MKIYGMSELICIQHLLRLAWLDQGIWTARHHRATSYPDAGARMDQLSF